MKKAATVAAALAGCMLLVALLYGVVALVALRTDAYPQEPPFGEMAAELVGYLNGSTAELSPSLFTERERLHMVDVLGLFQGSRAIALGCLLAAVLLCIAALAAGGANRLGSGLLIGFGVFALAAACIGGWAAIDFDGWFVRMHELVFTNDLWLLDPAESMLINMLPAEFFMAMVTKIGGAFAAGTALLTAFAVALRRVNGSKKPT